MRKTGIKYSENLPEFSFRSFDMPPYISRVRFLPCRDVLWARFFSPRVNGRIDLSFA